ncbi:Leucine-rich repeat-containing protein 58-like [Oopsacas minuta]|uniref:Leucine-rich repeat-containing protein 58-like n=1 Tax=Oopsacas minuta TaxID=111878 RepID=A0AAV7JJV8_9METZ|nr:Leucine-rich repeat-containing protein 58-like [Oopsacas minuta]
MAVQLQERTSPALEKLDFSDKQLTHWPSKDLPFNLTKLCLNSNSLIQVPDEIAKLSHLKEFDISNNLIQKISESFGSLEFLTIFTAKNNKIVELPENLSKLRKLKSLNLAGNLLQKIPIQVCDLARLESLHFGGNLINEIPPEIQHIERLQYLYLGGNQIEKVPVEVGQLRNLLSLNLSSNRITVLPRELDQLKSLESLLLHHNLLHFLPKNIINLENLLELSLRHNPLVHKFKLKVEKQVPSLVELSCYIIKKLHIPYETIIPKYLTNYLDGSKECDNPNCDGVYFETKVKKLQFVDFCGRYRVPLLEYLCNYCEYPSTLDGFSSSGSEDDEPTKASLKKIIMENL